MRMQSDSIRRRRSVGNAMRRRSPLGGAHSGVHQQVLPGWIPGRRAEKAERAEGRLVKTHHVGPLLEIVSAHWLGVLFRPWFEVACAISRSLGFAGLRQHRPISACFQRFWLSRALGATMKPFRPKPGRIDQTSPGRETQELFTQVRKITRQHQAAASRDPSKPSSARPSSPGGPAPWSRAARAWRNPGREFRARPQSPATNIARQPPRDRQAAQRPPHGRAAPAHLRYVHVTARPRWRAGPALFGN
jgi:hypothetical protein